MKLLFVVIALIFSAQVFSYVENVSKGYPNCMACHISPSGAGILTDYGRSLSSELMSTWKVSENFSKPYYGALHNTEHMKFGGQMRAIQVFAENDQIKLKKQFIMQNNAEFAIHYMNTFFVGTIGTQEGPDETEGKGEFLSERHYALWDVSDESKVRVGKYRQPFGINHPNHTRFVKNSLGFGSNSETYNIEFMSFFEWGELNTSISFGEKDKDEHTSQQTRNAILNLTHYLQGSSRLGLSILTGHNEKFKRDVIGVHIVHGFDTKLILRSELDLEYRNNINNNKFSSQKNALYGDHQVGYQIFKGGYSYLIFEHQQTDLSDDETKAISPGVGFQFLPVAHIELQFEYQQRTYLNDPNNPEHRSFVTFHLYH